MVRCCLERSPLAGVRHWRCASLAIEVDEDGEVEGEHEDAESDIENRSKHFHPLELPKSDEGEKHDHTQHNRESHHEVEALLGPRVQDGQQRLPCRMKTARKHAINDGSRCGIK